MTGPRLHLWLVVFTTISALPSAEQSQSCPVNINFSSASLNHWEAYTGNNKAGNGPGAINLVYDSNQSAPYGTSGATTLPEYNLPGVNGIRVVTSQGTDPFGGFQTIPTINGYAYPYSILLGSTSVAERQASDPLNGPPGQPTPPSMGPQGGYVRGISYRINVPPGPSTVPYTMTYAYAMVLENGTHASLDQPMARAIINTSGGGDKLRFARILSSNLCGALDSATAKANGFSLSPMPTPNLSVNPQDSGQHKQGCLDKRLDRSDF